MLLGDCAWGPHSGLEGDPLASLLDQVRSKSLPAADGYGGAGFQVSGLLGQPLRTKMDASRILARPSDFVVGINRPLCECSFDGTYSATAEINRTLQPPGPLWPLPRQLNRIDPPPWDIDMEDFCLPVRHGIF
jgi:hypothetical protein